MSGKSKNKIIRVTNETHKKILNLVEIFKEESVVSFVTRIVDEIHVYSNRENISDDSIIPRPLFSQTSVTLKEQVISVPADALLESYCEHDEIAPWDSENQMDHHTGYYVNYIVKGMFGSKVECTYDKALRTGLFLSDGKGYTIEMVKMIREEMGEGEYEDNAEEETFDSEGDESEEKNIDEEDDLGPIYL